MDRTLWIALFAALLITSIPSGAGILFPPPGGSWTGILTRNTADVNGYLSMIEEARQGHWRMRNLFTAEPHPAFQIRPLWLLLGLTGRFFPSLSNVYLMEIGRVITSFCLLLLIAALTLRLFASQRERLIAFLLLTLGSGLGWAHFVKDPPDLRIVETSTFLTLVSPPLYSLSLSLVLLILLLVERVWNGERKLFHGLLCGLCGLWLGFDRPFSLAPLGLAIGLFLLTEIAVHRDRDFRKWFALMPLAAGSFAAVTYQFLSLRNIPVYEEWNRQHVLPTPEWPRLLSSLGLLLIFGFAGGRYYFEKNRVLATLSLGFICGSLIFSHLPLGFQERFLEGLPVVTALFASCGLLRLLSHVSRPVPQTMIATIVLVVLAFSHFTPFRNDLVAIARQSPPQYMPNQFLSPMGQLRDLSAPTEPILSTQSTGNFLVAYTGRPVVIGHRVATARYLEKNKIVREFFSTPADNPSSRSLFDKTKARWLFWGPEESWSSRGRFDPERADYLVRKYDNGFVRLFKLRYKVTSGQ
jgi:hypothetical protein